MPISIKNLTQPDQLVTINFDIANERILHFASISTKLSSKLETKPETFQTPKNLNNLKSYPVKSFILNF